MDIKHRFVLRYRPTNKDGAWWIRARRWNVSHLISDMRIVIINAHPKESYSFLKPIMVGQGPPQSVYRTTVQEYHAHIGKYDLWCPTYLAYFQIQQEMEYPGYMMSLSTLIAAYLRTII